MSVIGTIEIKHDETTLNGKFLIECYDLIRLYHSRNGSGVACFVKHSVACSYKPNTCLNTESIFTDIYIERGRGRESR